MAEPSKQGPADGAKVPGSFTTMHRRVGVLLFASGWGANHFATLLPVYRVELGFTPASLGLLFGAYALGLVPGLLLAGRASDRRGRRALVLPAGAAAIGASALLALGAQGFLVLLLGRLLYGLAMGAIMSPGSVWVQELSPPGVGPRRATLALSAGFGLGPFVSSLIAEFAPQPMVLPYVAHAVAMAAALLLARPVPETAPGAAASPTPGAARGDSRDGWRLLAELSPMAPWVFGFAAVAIAILPGVVRPAVSRPVLYAGAVIVTTLGAGVLAQPLTGRLGRHSDLIGLGLGAIGVAVGSEAAARMSPALVLIAGPFLGAGYGLAITAGLRAIEARVPRERRGGVVGGYYVLTYVGFALPFAHARAAEALGDVVALRLTAALAVACIAARALTKRGR